MFHATAVSTILDLAALLQGFQLPLHGRTGDMRAAFDLACAGGTPEFFKIIVDVIDDQGKQAFIFCSHKMPSRYK